MDLELTNVNLNRIKTCEKMGWVAYLRDGSKVYEGEPTGRKLSGELGFSSDFLSTKDVVAIGYIPNRYKGSSILCEVNLAKGEKFTRYWTSIKLLCTCNSWQRLYVLGWYKTIDNKVYYKLLYYYPNYDHITLTNNRYACLPYVPGNDILMPGSVLTTGIGNRSISDVAGDAFLIHVSGGFVFKSEL